MVFRKRRKRKKKTMKTTLRNQIIPNKKSTQFLGMTLDRRLNEEDYIDSVKAKAKRALNSIKEVAAKK